MTDLTTPSALQGLSDDLAALVQQAAPSVVRVDDGTRLTATGIIWAADGLILTTSHGVEQDDSLAVEFADKTRLPANVVGRDSDSDLALLRVEASGLPAFFAAPDADAQVGRLVLALGRPGASGLHATLGLVTARVDAQTEGQAEHILHTDATLYPGFSGGPLISMSGGLVGLVNLAFGRGQSVALGVPILHTVVQSLLTQGTTTRGYLGVSTQSVALPETLRGTLALTQTYGLLIVQVGTGSPAEAAGLLLGDILLGLNEEAVEDADTLRRRLRASAAGQTVTLALARGGQKQDVGVTLGAQE